MNVKPNPIPVDAGGPVSIRPGGGRARRSPCTRTRATDAVAPVGAAFRLLKPGGKGLCWFEPARRARDVAAWLRHAVAEVCAGWRFGSTETIVHGHGGDRSELRRARFSYLPLPTITPLRTEGIARVFVVATPGRELIWKGEPMALLEPLPATDGVLPHYRATSDCWSTVTPVVLPGHDDHSGKKAERLLRTAFLQAKFEPEVVDSIRELAWQREGFRAGVDLASRYLAPDKVRGPQFHVRVRFATRVSGPIAIGSGCHRGMGVFAHAPG